MKDDDLIMIFLDGKVYKHSIYYTLSRLFLGGIFLLAGIPKIINPAGFSEIVYNYRLLPDILINLFALSLPWVETVAGILLLTNIWIPAMTLLCTALMFLFLGALGINMLRGLNIYCGSFAVEPSEVITDIKMWIYIARDIFFLFPCAYLLYHTMVFSKDNDITAIRNQVE